jgi:hypothetical protein
MWRLTSSGDTPDHPLLHTLNGKVGRQVWVFDPSAGTAEERQRVEELRERFTANRLGNKHSADELLRWAGGAAGPCRVTHGQSCQWPANHDRPPQALAPLILTASSCQCSIQVVLCLADWDAP